MKRTLLITVGVVSAALGLLVTGYMPGTLWCDSNGFMHGTGWWRYHYDSGALKLEERYVAGQLSLSRWFRRDRSLIAETHWRGGDGVGYFLRDNGSVRSKMEFRNGKAHGRAVYYKDDGVTVDYVAEFRDGQKVESQK
jgi:antitoxin component YwqK of YwqJK toxin-antitoxin module